MNLMSRHRLGHPGGRDMGLTSRPGLLNWRSRHPLRSRPGLFSQGEETMSRHPLRSRHGTGCLVQCTVLCTVWTLFMNTAHSKKKESTKILKIFLCMINVSRLCLCLRNTVLRFNCHVNCVDG